LTFDPLPPVVAFVACFLFRGIPITALRRTIGGRYRFSCFFPIIVPFFSSVPIVLLLIVVVVIIIIRVVPVVVIIIVGFCVRRWCFQRKLGVGDQWHLLFGGEGGHVLIVGHEVGSALHAIGPQALFFEDLGDQIVLAQCIGFLQI